MSFLLTLFGIRLHVEIDPNLPHRQKLLDSLISDYGYFESTDGHCSVSWNVQVRALSEKRIRWWPALWTPRSIVYWSRPQTRRVCFFGRSFVECDFSKRTATLFSADEGTGYESLYFVLESIISLELDRKGLHRLHALGATLDNTSVVVLGKSGTGKSTLFAHWLGEEESVFLGDDLVVTSDERLYSYPAKISFKKFPEQFPSSDVRIFDRQRYGRRFLVSSRSLSSRFQKSSPWGQLVLLKRGGKGEALMASAGRLSVFLWLTRWLVLGLETPQIAELFFPISPSAIREKSTHFLSRLRRAWRISQSVPGHRYLAPDGAARMSGMLRDFLKLSYSPAKVL